MDEGDSEWFAAGVRMFERRERAREHWRRKVLDIGKGKPEAVVQLLGPIVIGELRARRRYLQSTFGFDPRTNRWRGYQKTPTSEPGWCRFWIAYRVYQKASCHFGALLKGLATSGGQAGAALDAYLRADRVLVWPDGVDAMIVPWDPIRDESAARYIGTLLARVNLKRNQRLRNALNATTWAEQQIEISQRFPGAVIQALADGGPHEDPQTVLNRATRLIETEGRPRRTNRQRKNDRDGDPESWPKRPEERKYNPLRLTLELLRDGFPPDVVDTALREQGLGSLQDVLGPPRSESDSHLWHEFTGLAVPNEPAILDDFTAREEAATQLREIEAMADEVLELALSAGLSHREAEVIALTSTGMKPAAIARRLGIAASTARVHLLNARRKYSASA